MPRWAYHTSRTVMREQEDFELELLRAVDRLPAPVSICFALLLLLGGMVGLVAGTSWIERRPVVSRVALCVGAIAVGSSLTIIARLRRRFAPSGASVLTTDDRPPVVYFRAFLTDDAMNEELKFGPLVLDAGGLVRDLLPLPLTSEQRLAAMLRRLGPCIALGDPGDELPPLGFSRLYVDDDQWHESVQSLLARAQLVIIRASRLTDSLQWEIATVVARVPPERVLIFLPYTFHGQLTKTQSVFGNAGDYAVFRTTTEVLFPKGLPDWDCRGVFVRFDRDWSPRIGVAERTLRRTLRTALAINA